MPSLLALVVALPFAGFLLLSLGGARLPARAVGIIGVSSVAISAVLAVAVFVALAASGPAEVRFVDTVWTWIDVGPFAPAVAFSLDGLSAVMMLVVTLVGLLIHVYAAAYMRSDASYRRFFAYMNLFVGFMLVLVLADNLLLLYLGWEGVGLASYLLIGFWYQRPENGYAARKAFIVTRIGDTALAIGLFLLFWELGTVDIAQVITRAEQLLVEGSAVANLSAALILAGAAGKSAQVPLHVWLPDAMAGPTPVSALIHAATMVTAGVYLIARLHPIFEAAPAVLVAVAIVGAVTLLLAALAALGQRDVKRVLAYSTISQLGYMVVALGAGAYAAAIAHLVTHAFFKALLFLSAGVVIASLRGEHDLWRMGGLRRVLHLPFWSFGIGAASLAAVPVVTAGFYSKELILWNVWVAEPGGAWLAAVLLAGTFLTALYAFRAFFLAFFGKLRDAPSPPPRGGLIAAPLVILAVLAIVGGLFETSAYFGGIELLTLTLGDSLPAAAHGVGADALALMIGASGLSLLGIAAAYLAYGPRVLPRRAGGYLPAAGRAAEAGFGFDAAYERIVVGPFRRLARGLRDEPVDLVYEAVARLLRAAHGVLAFTQRGRVRVYLAVLLLGSLAVLAYSVMA